MRITFEMGTRREYTTFLGFRKTWRIQERAWHLNLEFCIGIWNFCTIRYPALAFFCLFWERVSEHGMRFYSH
jgi:hypothetical protein